MARSLLFCIFSVVACGGDQANTTQSAERKPELQPAPTPTSDKDPIELPLDATFGELIATINQRPEAESDSPVSCILVPSSSFKLDSPTAQAMRPLPPPPDDLDEHFDAVPDTVRLLTLWGQVGVEADRLVAVTFTMTSAEQKRTLFSALTDRGIILRNDNLKGDAQTHAQALRALEKETPPPSHVVVSAEKNVPLRHIYAWLQTLHSFPELSVSLAVMLPEGTKVPEPPLEHATELRCGESAIDSTGDVDVAAVQAEISKTTPTLAGCLSPGRGSRGGTAAVQLSVSSTGEVDSVCIAEGSFDSAESERCVLDALRTIALPAPTPAGSRATLLLPLALRPKPSPPIRPLCAP